MRQTLLLLAALAAGSCSGASAERLVVRTVSEYTGAPMAGVRVQVNDQAWAATDASGSATFDGVPGMFTVRVHQTYAAQNGARYDKVFELRDRTGSEVVAEIDGSPEFRQAQVSGQVAGSTGQPTSVISVQGGHTSGVAAADGSFGPLAIQWQGGSAATVTLRAIERDAAAMPGHYHGYGAASVAVSEGGSVSGAALTLAPVSEGQVTGTVAVPAVYSGGLSGMPWLRFSAYETLGLINATTPSAPLTFSIMLPRVSGGVPWVGYFATSPGSTGPAGPSAEHSRAVAIPSSGIALDLPAPVELTAPADGATVGSSTTFRWSAGPAGGRYTLFLYCDWDEAGRARHVGYRGIETSATQATLPAIPGLSLASGAACRWSVLWCAAADPAVERRCSSSAERTATAL